MTPISRNASHFMASRASPAVVMIERISIKDERDLYKPHRTVALSRLSARIIYFLVKFLVVVFFPFMFAALANTLHARSILCIKCSNVLFDVIVSACVSGSGRKFTYLTVDNSVCRTERALNEYGSFRRGKNFFQNIRQRREIGMVERRFALSGASSVCDFAVAVAD